MPNQKNIQQLTDIEEKLSRSKSVVIAGYPGLDVATQTELRAKIREAGGELNIAKNTLIRLALQNRLKDLPESLKEALQGPSAILYGFDDAVSATKAIVEFQKDQSNLKIKAGLLAGQEDAPDKVLSFEEVKNLAQLPSRLELIAMLVNRLNSPKAGLVNVLAGTQRKFLYALNAIKEKQESAVSS